MGLTPAPDPARDGPDTTAVAPLRGLFRRQADPYADVDMNNSRRMGGLLWFIGALCTAVLLPLAPPTHAIGGAGWAVAGAIVLGCALGAVRLLRAPIHPTELLAMSYVAVAMIAVLEWLAGGRSSPYHQLYLLSVIYTAAVHPPRRVIPYLAAFAAAVCSPLLYEHWSSQQVGGAGMEVLLLTGVSLIAMLLMDGVRRQRRSLGEESAHAQKLARVDPLTELGNRRAFDEALVRELARARRTSRPVSIVVADVKGLKRINDSFGHLEGDRVLRTVASVLTGSVRGPDACYRWGGDEFAVILAETERDGAEVVAWRIAETLQAQESAGDSPIGLSLGVAELDGSEDASTALARADAALITAKGRLDEDSAASDLAG